jgi:hypothetical protein
MAPFDERAFVAAVRAGRVVVSPWVDVDRVELVRRGEVGGVWSAPFPKGPHRFEARVKRPLKKGDWIIALARGTKPMSYLYRPNARPFASTNPIWVE